MTAKGYAAAADQQRNKAQLTTRLWRFEVGISLPRQESLERPKSGFRQRSFNELYFLAIIYLLRSLFLFHPLRRQSSKDYPCPI